MPQPPEVPDLSITDVAELLDVNVRTVRRYIAIGRLPAYRIGGSRLIRLRREDVAALFEPMSADEAS